MHDLKPILEGHPFFSGLKAEYLDFIVGCASNVRFKEGEIILREGDAADKFFLVREGKVALEINVPQHEPITFQTIEGGDILGWSWLIPPHFYRFTCRTLADTRAIALDGKCLRNKCEENRDMGYELLKRLAGVFTQRLEVTRKQLINIYDIERNK
ncbi:MAG: cyclic nucleotide-binding domain-containing protein [Candidatus Omnitrophica bacterium]|nr:cyclic nucleotide-binding domain-containing protein [Candidatus Omnitrophota bacterium]